MSFTVRLYRGNTPVIVHGMKLCLGHLAMMIHPATRTGAGVNDLQLLIDIAANAFVEFDGTTDVDSTLPDFDRAFHYRFSGVGAWGAKNVIGTLELLFRGDEFLQVGIQVAIKPIMFFGTKRSVSNVIDEFSTAVETLYGQPLPEPFTAGPIVMSMISDAITHCYLSFLPSARPVVTCRIGNRAIWDAESIFGA